MWPFNKHSNYCCTSCTLFVHKDYMGDQVNKHIWQNSGFMFVNKNKRDCDYSKLTFTKCLILLNLNHPYARTTLFLTCSEQKIFKRIISPFDFRTIFFDDYKASYKILSEITQGNKKTLKSYKRYCSWFELMKGP